MSEASRLDSRIEQAACSKNYLRAARIPGCCSFFWIFLPTFRPSGAGNWRPRRGGMLVEKTYRLNASHRDATGADVPGHTAPHVACYVNMGVVVEVMRLAFRFGNVWASRCDQRLLTSPATSIWVWQSK
jgi:hypothetical protein